MFSFRIVLIVISLALTGCASTPSSTPRCAEEGEFTLSNLRHILQQSHDDLMTQYEEQDALYADLELDVSLADDLTEHLTALRFLYLDYQVQHGEMLAYHHRATQNGGSLGDIADPMDRRHRRIDDHHHHSQMELIAQFHAELIALHREMAQLNRQAHRIDLFQRHEALAHEHRLIRAICVEVMVLMEETYGVDPDDESMPESIESMPDEREAPDRTKLL